MKKRTELYFDGSCPECALTGDQVFLSRNAGDILECPKCHLLIAMANLGRAVVCRRRGRGNFCDLSDKRFSSERIRGLLLVREKVDDAYRPDKFNVINDEKELRAYIAECREIDECC
jgi:hypothetical protein